MVELPGGMLELNSRDLRGSSFRTVMTTDDEVSPRHDTHARSRAHTHTRRHVHMHAAQRNAAQRNALMHAHLRQQMWSLTVAHACNRQRDVAMRIGQRVWAACTAQPSPAQLWKETEVVGAHVGPRAERQAAVRAQD